MSLILILEVEYIPSVYRSWHESSGIVNCANFSVDSLACEPWYVGDESV